MQRVSSETPPRANGRTIHGRLIADVDSGAAGAGLDDEEREPLGDAARSLSGIKLLRGLGAEALRDIEAKCRWHRYLENEQVLDRGCHLGEVYFIVAGAVRITVYSGGEREVHSAELSAGDHMEELSARDGAPHSTEAFAVTETVLASLSHEDFVRMLLKHPEVSPRLSKSLVDIIRARDERTADLGTLTPRQRVYGELLRLAEPVVTSDGPWAIRNLPKHREIASRTRTTPVAVAQAIGRLVRQGVVERRHKTLYINDRLRLHGLVRETEADPVHSERVGVSAPGE